ncbi:hypothetical protein ACA910_022552 [Epithemia clementina (nom. ined.)]
MIKDAVNNGYSQQRQRHRCPINDGDDDNNNNTRTKTTNHQERPTRPTHYRLTEQVVLPASASSTSKAAYYTFTNNLIQQHLERIKRRSRWLGWWHFRWLVFCSGCLVVVTAWTVVSILPWGIQPGIPTASASTNQEQSTTNSVSSQLLRINFQNFQQTPHVPRYVWNTEKEASTSGNPVATINKSQQFISIALPRELNQEPGKVEEEYVSVCLTRACFQHLGAQLARAFPDRSQQRSSWCFSSSSSSSSSNPVAVHGDGAAFDAHNETTSTSATASTVIAEGLILVKVPKAASSTCAGLILRIANQSSCRVVHYLHREARFYFAASFPPPSFNNRTTLETPAARGALAHPSYFMVGSVREPGSRTYSSAWFFMLAPLNITPTDANVIRSLNTRRAGGNTKGRGGYQYNYLSPKPLFAHSVWNPDHPTRVRNPSALYTKLQQLFQAYDFIIVVERMDESVTALALTMGIPLSHVLVPNAKVASSSNSDQNCNNSSLFDDNHHRRHHNPTHEGSNSTTNGGESTNYILSRFGRQKGRCTRPGTQPMSAAVRQYLSSSPTWLAGTYADQLVYWAAQGSLDQTIAQIGRAKFAQALAEYRQLRAHVQTYCGPRIGSGCTDTGLPIQPMEQCYDRDFGCGYQCIDEAVRVISGQSTSTS